MTSVAETRLIVHSSSLRLVKLFRAITATNRYTENIKIKKTKLSIFNYKSKVCQDNPSQGLKAYYGAFD